MKKLLITGATGFVGKNIALYLIEENKYTLKLSSRNRSTIENEKHVYVCEDLTNEFAWQKHLTDVDSVLHCAALSHCNNDSKDELHVLKKVNVAGTLNLARQCAKADVRRFIFVSSIKVNGEQTEPEQCFREQDMAAPEDPYGISKMEAEQGLRKLASETNLEVVIVRPPLVYGPGVKGNFLNLLKIANCRIPLPFGSIQNQRSMIYLGNLVDVLIHCIDSPKAANKTFLVSDGEDLSTSGLLRMLRDKMAVPAMLIPIPVEVFNWVGRLTGKSQLVDRLCGSLRVDSSKVREELGWTPPFTVEQGMAATVDDFVSKK